jgi:hypothetical protein
MFFESPIERERNDVDSFLLFDTVDDHTFFVRIVSRAERHHACRFVPCDSFMHRLGVVGGTDRHDTIYVGSAVGLCALCRLHVTGTDVLLGMGNLKRMRGREEEKGTMSNSNLDCELPPLKSMRSLLLTLSLSTCQMASFDANTCCEFEM